MRDFFSNEIGQTLEWFGLSHILLTIGFIVTVILLWIFAPKLRNNKHEKWFRILLIILVFAFEWRVFESRMLEGSIFRMPLCAIALYSLTYSVAFRKEKVFKIAYFFAFGSIISFLFYDTPFGLDRWNAWSFFGAHATIAWLAVYGYKIFGFTPVKRDLYRSMIFLTIYATISGYATLRFGGSDELFLFTPAVDFLYALKDIHWILYIGLFSLFVFGLLCAMYIPIYLSEKSK